MIKVGGSRHVGVAALVSDPPLGLASPLERASGAATESVDRRAKQREREERVRRVVDAHADAVWRFLRRLGVAEMDLEDVLQEVAVVTAERLADIPDGRERPFLFGTAFNVASEYRRRRTSRREVGDEALGEAEDPVPTPEVLTDQARARAVLDRVLAEMPLELRAVFTLYEIEEMTMAEIADLLGLAPGTVASRLRRARETFDAGVARIERGGRVTQRTKGGGR